MISDNFFIEFAIDVIIEAVINEIATSVLKPPYISLIAYHARNKEGVSLKISRSINKVFSIILCFFRRRNESIGGIVLDAK